MSDYLLPLDTAESSLDVLGGKGRSLARMATAGMSVPGGFQITTAAYRSFVADNNLQAKILELAKPEFRNRRVSFDLASENIQKLFESVELSAEVVAEICEAYAALDGDDPAVAVRSSANAEDLPDMSFAGQQETYLNVRGEEALLNAVRNCWASLWTPRAISYRHQMGIEQNTVAMAVVVQLMVPSDVSGILFTANPATGERSEIIINASFGLGEAVVGGQVTPDTFILDRETLTAKETTIGTKEQQIVSDGDQGVRLEDIAESERGKSSLSDEALKELASLALKVEEHFDGAPQDIEWAFSDGKLYLLQSRPITNLPPQPIPDNWEPTPPAKYMVRRQIVENMPDPICPLFEELYLEEGLMLEMTGGSADSPEWKECMDGPLYTTVNGVAYQRFDWKASSKFRIPGVNFEPDTSIEEAVEVEYDKLRETIKTPEQAAMAKHDLALFLESLSDEDRKAFNEMAEEEDRESLPQRVTVPEGDAIRFYAHNRTQPCDQLMRDWKERALADLSATIDDWKTVDPAAASDEQLLDGIRALGHAEGRYWSGRNCAKIFGVIKACDEQLHYFLNETAPDQGFSSGQFLSGFDSKLMQANEELWKISKLIQANDSLCELVLVTPNVRLMDSLQAHPDSGPVLEAFHAYLDAYGHQGYSLDFVEAPPVEEPSPIFATFKTMVADPDYDPKKHAIEATRTRKAAFEKAEEFFTGLSYWQFRYRVWYAYRYYPYREELLFRLGISWPILRPMAAEFGRRMVDVGTFTVADDTYYLKMAELSACAGNKALPKYGQLAAERRELREARKYLRAPSAIPPEIIGHPMIKEVQAANDPDGDTLNGVPVSPGSVTAAASLIDSPAEFDKMLPDSILVCPMTTPAWTQLFAHAKGLVTDIGGILGHGSIVAREYGIPAVVGTGISTERIQHEQQISVDGDAGTVTLLTEDE
jgi:phosphohistidine swiveling domain-containing protein